VDNLQKFLNNLSKQFQAAWGPLSHVKRFAILGAIMSLVVGTAILVMTREGPKYEYLFVNLSAEDSTEIVAYLRKANQTDFIVDNRGVKVPSARVAELRISLAQEGLPTKGIVGWEKFDKSDFTRTEFEQQINKMRAVQGELARTIMQLEGVQTARVHIVVPRNSLFVEDRKDPTAAIYIKPARGFTMNPRQIRGITHLVSRSVEGLHADNITIIDYDGRLLSEETSGDPSSKQTKEMLAYQRNIEKNFEERIRAIVGRVVGPDRVEAKVDVTIDFTREEQTISDVNPDRVAVISSNTSNMNLAGTGLNPTGIPGAKSNVPGEQEALNLASAQTSNKKDTERFNYEVAKTVSHRILPVGDVTRISAAVLVDGKQPYTVSGSATDFEARTAEEMAKIEELVKGAIGFQEQRDHVKVHNMLFQLDQIQVEAISEQRKESQEYITTLAISSAVALAIVFFFAFIVRPYFRWLAYDPQKKSNEEIFEEFRPDLELGSIQSVQVKEDVPFDKLTPQEQVMYLAKHEPARTTEAIRIMLSPHQSAPH